MPALQSVWFVPHVTAYILSYAILGAATIVGIKQLYKFNKNDDENLLEFTDNLVYVGFGLLMLGMLIREQCGQKLPGDIIGRGIRRKPGPLSQLQPTFFISTFAGI